MRRQIMGSVRAGESTIRVAERLLDTGRPAVELPQYVTELKDAAKFAQMQGDPNIYLEAVERWKGRVERLGQGKLQPGSYSVRTSGQQLIKELQKAKPEQIDKIIDRWVLDRARHQARLVARHETVEACRDTYRKSTEEQPYTHGYRWTLSGSHPAQDVCDIYAEQDTDGLGPGGYAASNVPSTPHPACLCHQVAIIDRNHFRRQLAKARGEKAPPKAWKKRTHRTAEQWLKSIPAQKRLAILGPTRAEALRQGKAVVDRTGKPLPVYQVTGKPKPKIKHGPRVEATPIVRRDRESMVRPFPNVPPAE